jgi:protoporphyrinogen oxidase
LQTNYPSVQRSFDLASLDLQNFDSGAKLWLDGRWNSFLNPLRSGFNFLSLVPRLITIKDLFLLARLWVKLQWSSKQHVVSRESTIDLFNRWGFSDTFQSTFLKPFFQGIYLDKDLLQPVSLFFFYMQQFLEGQAALPAHGMAALVNQLSHALPKDSVRTKVEVVQVTDGQLRLKNDEVVEFDRLILALDPQAAANLLQVQLPESVHLGSKTFYFALPARVIKDKLLHLLPADSGLLHYCFLSHITPSYSPEGQDLVQVTSLNLSLDFADALRLLADFEDVADFKFLRAYAIPKSLTRMNAFDGIRLAAQKHGIVLAGDYCEMPSLQGALVSGEQAIASA